MSTPLGDMSDDELRDKIAKLKAECERVKLQSLCYKLATDFMLMQIMGERFLQYIKSMKANKSFKI